MTTIGDVALDELDAAAAARFGEDVLRVYAAAMMPPPYSKSIADVQMFAGTYERHLERSGFRMFVARRDGQIVGYTYGYRSVPGTWWRDHVAEALGPQRSREWLTDAFEFAELAVSPQHRRAGIGSALHDALLDGVGTRTSVLSTLEEDTAGSNLYEKKGWRTLLDDFWFTNTAVPYRVMGIELEGLMRSRAG